MVHGSNVRTSSWTLGALLVFTDARFLLFTAFLSISRDGPMVRDNFEAFKVYKNVRVHRIENDRIATYYIILRNEQTKSRNSSVNGTNDNLKKQK